MKTRAERLESAARARAGTANRSNTHTGVPAGSNKARDRERGTAVSFYLLLALFMAQAGHRGHAAGPSFGAETELHAACPIGDM